MTASTICAPDRNQTAHGRIRRVDEQAHRPSDPVPPPSRVSVPVPRTIPARRTTSAPSGVVLRGRTGHSLRTCRRCETDQPAYLFLHLHRKDARERQWATVNWCGPCLVRHGHATDRQLAEVRALEEAPAPLPRVLLSPAQHQLVAQRIADHALLAAVLERADECPEFGAALDRARAIQRKEAW